MNLIKLLLIGILRAFLLIIFVPFVPVYALVHGIMDWVAESEAKLAERWDALMEES